MSKVETIKNVAVYTDLMDSSANWNKDLNLGFEPDEVYVRQITYCGPADQDGAYLIWSNLNQGHIGSFSLFDDPDRGSVCVNATPNTLIKCQGNTPMNLQFQLFSIDSDSKPVHSTFLKGTLIINLDFVKYKSRR